VPDARHQRALLHDRSRKAPRAAAAMASRYALSSTSSRKSDLVSVFNGGRRAQVPVASREGRGFIVPEDECIANTRKGKQILNVTNARTKLAP